MILICGVPVPYPVYATEAQSNRDKFLVLKPAVIGYQLIIYFIKINKFLHVLPENSSEKREPPRHFVSPLPDKSGCTT